MTKLQKELYKDFIEAEIESALEDAGIPVTPVHKRALAMILAVGVLEKLDIPAHDAAKISAKDIKLFGNKAKEALTTLFV